MYTRSETLNDHEIAFTSSPMNTAIQPPKEIPAVPTEQNKPSKEQAREFIRRRVEEHQPPPSIKEIRRRLGWELVSASR